MMAVVEHGNTESLLTAGAQEGFSDLVSYTEATSPRDAEPLSKLFITPLGFKVTYLGVGAFGMLGNLMVVVIMLNSRALRSTFTNKFITNQSMIDFSSSFFILITNMIRDPAPKVLGDGVAQDVWCLLWMTKWPLFGTFMASTFNLVAMTLERYYAIVYPLHHARCFTTRKAYVIMVLVWLGGFGWHASYGVTPTARIDGICRTQVFPSKTVQRAVTTFAMVIQFIIPILLITAVYLHIFITLRRSSKAGSNMSAGQDVREERMKTARKNVVKTLVKVFVCFVCCWTPNQVFLIGWNFNFTFSPDASYYHCSVLFLFINSSINPVVYSLTYQQFQQEQKRLFCRSCVRDSPNSDNSKELSKMSASTSVSTLDKSGMNTVA